MMNVFFTNLLAGSIPIYPDGGKLEGKGPLGLEGIEAATGPTLFTNIISGAIAVMTIIAAIWFVFILASGALTLITSGSDKNAVEGARTRISQGLIGLIIVVAAIFLTELIGNLIGIDSILDPGTFVETFEL